MKSHSMVLLEVAVTIYKDACTACVAEISNRDIKTIVSRVEDEGISFLTITLPSFSSDLERSLEEGMVDPKLFRNFRKNQSIPAFLQGMTSRIFDIETGRIINDDQNAFPPDVVARTVDSIRQICLAFKKIELPCTPNRTFKALENFIEIERSFDMLTLSGEDTEIFLRVSSLLWGSRFYAERVDSILPRHGPGATSERISGNQKFAWKFWHERLEPYLPLIDGGFPISCGELPFRGSELEDVIVLSKDSELPVRVTPVPKTLKGPRIIAIEPCCMQYAQQGIRRIIYDSIESYWLTSGHINFRDQSINQSLALMASKNREYATIDLSDASDRVPYQLALQMFNANPDFRDAIDACRSTHAAMPDGSIIGPLNKFASMGSALCFPVEAMYFYTICVIASLVAKNLPISWSTIKLVAKDIYVYGDDIIVPTDVATTVLDYLHKYNCKVNDRKTFYRGSFRESCGVDAYRGYAVKPVYVGMVLPENRQQSHEFLSNVETANLFFRKGYLRTSILIFSKIEEVFGKLPTVSESSHVIGRNHYWHKDPSRKRWNSKTQQVEILAWVPSPVYRTDPLEGYAALQKCLQRLRYKPETSEVCFRPGMTYLDYVETMSSLDVKHLERTARHGAVTTFRRWVPVSLTGDVG
jgi:hypothetical protein